MLSGRLREAQELFATAMRSPVYGFFSQPPYNPFTSVINPLKAHVDILLDNSFALLEECIHDMPMPPVRLLPRKI